MRGQFGGGGLHLCRGFALGIGDAAVGERGATSDLFFQLHLGVGRHTLSVGPGLGQHGDALSLGFLTLATYVRQHGLGLGAKTRGLVEVELDRGRLGVQHAERGLVSPGIDRDGEEQDQPDRNPQLRVRQAPEREFEKRGHVALSLMLGEGGRKRRLGSGDTSQFLDDGRSGIGSDLADAGHRDVA